MTNKITVVVDIDNDEELTEHGSLEHGVYGIDCDGVYHMWYGSKNYLVSFFPHTCEEYKEQEEKEYGRCYYCEYCSEEKRVCNCEQIIDKNIQAQERTEQQ